MKRPLGWEPVAKPDGTYCSPACGGRCTQAAFDKATQDAKELASYMGEGWTPHVWENLGWYYRVVLQDGLAEVYPHRDGRFWCSINTSKQFMGESDNPKVAFKLALEDAHCFNLKLAVQLENLKGGL